MNAQKNSVDETDMNKHSPCPQKVREWAPYTNHKDTKQNMVRHQRPEQQEIALCEQVEDSGTVTKEGIPAEQAPEQGAQHVTRIHLLKNPKSKGTFYQSCKNSLTYNRSDRCWDRSPLYSGSKRQSWKGFGGSKDHCPPYNWRGLRLWKGSVLHEVGQQTSGRTRLEVSLTSYAMSCGKAVSWEIQMRLCKRAP